MAYYKIYNSNFSHFRRAEDWLHNRGYPAEMLLFNYKPVKSDLVRKYEKEETDSWRIQLSEHMKRRTKDYIIQGYKTLKPKGRKEMRHDKTILMLTILKDACPDKDVSVLDEDTVTQVDPHTFYGIIEEDLEAEPDGADFIAELRKNLNGLRRRVKRENGVARLQSTMYMLDRHDTSREKLKEGRYFLFDMPKWKIALVIVYKLGSLEEVGQYRLLTERGEEEREEMIWDWEEEGEGEWDSEDDDEGEWDLEDEDDEEGKGEDDEEGDGEDEEDDEEEEEEEGDFEEEEEEDEDEEEEEEEDGDLEDEEEEQKHTRPRH